ncbi:MAG: sigma-70 family RNA polymerase sigma factor [Fuerstiella sp.]
MSDIPDTQYSLLARLSDPSDREAWQQFADLYQPVIYRIARGRGFQDADAQDLAQQVLMSVSRAIPGWKKTSAETRFRHWLKKVTRNAALNALTRGPKESAAASSVLVAIQNDAHADSALEQQIDVEHRREVYRQAAVIVQQQVQPVTWDAFRRSTLLNQSVTEVSQQTGLTVGSVYVARSRVLSRLRAAVAEIEKGLES